METLKIEISTGVAALITNAQKKLPEGSITFAGDMAQMAAAANVAEELGIKFGMAAGFAYVTNQSDFQRVVDYLIEHKINGYHHYQ
jgi:hypothetical protein